MSGLNKRSTDPVADQGKMKREKTSIITKEFKTKGNAAQSFDADSNSAFRKTMRDMRKRKK